MKIVIIMTDIIGDVRVFENSGLYRIRSTYSKQMFDYFWNCLEKEVVRKKLVA